MAGTHPASRYFYIGLWTIRDPIACIGSIGDEDSITIDRCVDTSLESGILGGDEYGIGICW